LIVLNRNYPTPTMTAIPTVLIEAFSAERDIESDSEKLAESLDETSTQRVYALFEGACQRAVTCGGLAGHDKQAAAMLVAIKEFDNFLMGGLTVGGDRELARKLDDEEMGALQFVRRVLAGLLEWHFDNGAGRLLPFADWLGLVQKER
jgi:hypothetical protein